MLGGRNHAIEFIYVMSSKQKLVAQSYAESAECLKYLLWITQESSASKGGVTNRLKKKKTLVSKNTPNSGVTDFIIINEQTFELRNRDSK